MAEEGDIQWPRPHGQRKAVLVVLVVLVLGYTGRQLATAARTDARITVGRILENVVVDGEESWPVFVRDTQ